MAPVFISLRRVHALNMVDRRTNQTKSKRSFNIVFPRVASPIKFSIKRHKNNLCPQSQRKLTKKKQQTNNDAKCCKRFSSNRMMHARDIKLGLVMDVIDNIKSQSGPACASTNRTKNRSKTMALAAFSESPTRLRHARFIRRHTCGGTPR